ncbi:FRAS1-related extracellular matrix protein 1-like [Ambystoma mexicanum]|uniref:FRAS1-related extracellular matrix protein 1-like n=1 Tax=Ambystoma mexicanum TaxID=8296 RepID=UPI0037E821DF
MNVKHSFLVQFVLISFVHLRQIDTAQLVLVNEGISVGRGQMAYLSEKELKFNIPAEKDSCKVEVVLNEPTTQRVGRLTPQVFDCHFLSDEVKYIHNGSPLLQEDTVMLRVYRFTLLETNVETTILRVQIVDPRSGIVNFGQRQLEVTEFLGVTTKPVDKNILSIKHNRERSANICTVRLLTSEILFPAYGQLVVDAPKLQRREDDVGMQKSNRERKVRQVNRPCPSNKACLSQLKPINLLKAKCDDFLQMGIKYQHLSPPSPAVDYIPIQVELRDEHSRFPLQTENVWIPVEIKGALENTVPRAAFMSMFILEIDQFILTPLSTAAIDAEDDETPRDRLVFNITKPPPVGYITHLDDHTKAITSFTWQDLNEMNIAYQPPNITHAQRQNYEVEFEAIDGHFNNSSPIMVHFSIRAAETNAPRVSWNMGLDLLEGQSRPITWESFQIVDNDNLDAVRLVTVEGLQHGQLTVRGGKSFMFTVQDIKDGVIRYHHDDSDTTKDYIVFRIFDGKYSIRHKFPINILPKDDSPPFLVVNVAFELAEGGTILVENHMLMASDFDSSDDYILYKITKAPKAGELIKKHFTDLSGAVVSSFLQRDLFHGLIHYHHLGGELFEDSFEFILSDSHDPPNYSDAQVVMITIMPVKDQLPKEVTGTNRHLIVKETDVLQITKNHLHFTDTESPDNQLLYTVTKRCFSPNSPSIQDAGKLIFTDTMKDIKKDSSLPALKSFTQHAVTHLKVAYMPPQEDIGPEVLDVQFEFSVSDQQGGEVTGLVFNITVMPVDDKAPEIFTNPIRTEEGASAYITGENLMVTDRDTKNDDIRVQLKKGPQHGNIELQGVILQDGDMFTLGDLHSFKIRYQHDDSETKEDVVIFTATDGLNAADGELRVQITPVNDEPPELHGKLKSGLECKEGGHVIITAEYLYATDADSDDTKLTYMIARAPVYGMLQRAGVMAEKFSQLDVSQGLISYIHTGGEIGHSACMDTVTLIVSDGEAGTVDSCCIDGPLPPPVPLHANLPVYDLNITVQPVNNQHPVITIGEMFIVDEGSSACVTLDYLRAADDDTLSEELTFILETTPQFGYLENTLPTPGYEKSNAGINIRSFSLWNLTVGYINYVQSKHEQQEPTADQFMIHVSDGVHRSIAMPFYVLINPTNDEIPDLHVKNLTIMEGDMCEIGPSTLNAEDLDIPQDTLTFSVITPPSHGMLVNAVYGRDIGRYKQVALVLQQNLQIHSFALEELKQGMMLAYMHDDSESPQDCFTIQLTDGRHTVQRTLHVRIIPVNDELPRITRNAGVEVEVAESKVISSVALEAEDKDNAGHELLYIIDNAPKYGELKLKTASVWVTVHPGMNFTQDDVELNHLWYFHTTIMKSKNHDSFRFYVTDGNNRSPPENFYISIKNMDKGDIVLLTKPVTLTAGDRVTLTTDVLMAADGTGKPEKLLFAISVPPVHGQIEYINYPGVPTSSFSQLGLVAQKICYVHDNSHEAIRDSFSFTISNGLQAKDGFMQFNIEHPDRIPPTLVSTKGIQLLQGSMVVISHDILELTDPDSPLENLIYRVVQQPQHGHLFLKGSVLQQDQFTQSDVNNMHLSYKHNGGGGELDKFLFLASDMINRGFLVDGQLREDPVVFTIQVEHVDRFAPTITIKESPSAVESLKDGRVAVQITAQNLKASDPDSRDEDLTYMILRPPYFGHLENVKTGSHIGSAFTQRDLNARAIRYIINPTIDVTSDSFEFRVSDPAGNSMISEILEIKWSRIEMAEAYYRICENVGTVAIKVMRRGQSKDPSFVGIKVQEVSARVGSDFTHSTASLIQFDPGVSTKSWNVYIRNDGLEENHEMLKIVLSKPKNAVLGQNNETTIEIMDLRPGGCNPVDSLASDTRGMTEGGHKPSKPFWDSSTTQKTSEDDMPAIESDDHRVPSLRGDVPQSDHHFHFSAVVISDAVTPRPIGNQLRANGNSRVYHGIMPMIMEEQFLSQSQTRRADRWPPLARPMHGNTRHDLPQRDSGVRNEERNSPSITAKGTNTTKCPSGWTLRDKHCYFLNSLRNATWEMAEIACRHMYSSHLTSVHSKKEMKWLWRFAEKQRFWIGLVESGGSLAWSNGRPVTYSSLKQGTPSERAQAKCVLVRRKNKWLTRNCRRGQKERYICSVPL